MRRWRQIHNLLAAFFAPAILFFAFSGALQTFSLHENKGGGPYQPPAWIVALASVHKDQHLPYPKPPPKTQGAAAQGEGAQDQGAPGKGAHGPEAHKAPAAHPQKHRSALPLKIFVLAVAIGLIATALIGLYIGLSNRVTRRNTVIMMALGTLLPVALLFL